MAEEDGQHLSLLDDQGTQRRPIGRVGFWKNLFRRGKSNYNNDEDENHPQEDEALLSSCPNLDFEYRDDRRSSPLLSRSREYNDNDDKDDDDDDDKKEEKGNHGNNNYQTMGHQLLMSYGDDDDANEVHLLDIHGSEPIICFEAKNLVHYGEDKEDEDCDDDTNKEDGSGSGSGSGESGEGTDDDDDADNGTEGDHRDNVKPFGSLAMQRSLSVNSRPPISMQQRSLSVGSYSDQVTNENTIFDSNSRRRIQGRIEGFGTPKPRVQDSDNLKTFRDRILSLTNSRMKRMSIGTEDTMRRPTWTEALVNTVDGLIDAVAPPPPEIDGYINAFRVKEDQPVPPKPNENSPVEQFTNGSSSQEPFGSRRPDLAHVDDKTYIIFLECELKNKEIELSAWKRRVKELEVEVNKLKGNEVGDDSSVAADDSDDDGLEDKKESEIEWQTGAPQEGVLIDIEGSEAPSASSQVPNSHQRRNSHQSRRTDESVTVVLETPTIERSGLQESLGEPKKVMEATKGVLQAEMHNASHSSPVQNCYSDSSSVVSDGGDEAASVDDSDSDTEDDGGTKKGVLIDLTKEIEDSEPNGNAPLEREVVDLTEDDYSYHGKKHRVLDSASVLRGDTGSVSGEPEQDEETDSNYESNEEDEKVPTEGILIDLTKEDKNSEPNGVSMDENENFDRKDGACQLLGGSGSSPVKQGDGDNSASREAEEDEETDSNNESEGLGNDVPREGILIELTQENKYPGADREIDLISFVVSNVDVTNKEPTAARDEGEVVKEQW